MYARKIVNVFAQNIDIKCRTDASFLGWGAYDLQSGKCTNDRWKVKELEHSINYLELLAVFHALQALYGSYNGLHIQVQVDNCSAGVLLMGNMTSFEMDMLAKDIWQWCLDGDIYISASHLSTFKMKLPIFFQDIFLTLLNGI